MTTDPAPQDLLDRYIREAARILDDWDRYSDKHSDEDGWPLNGDAYGRRKEQRDADTWRAFRPLLHSGHRLLDAAVARITTLPPAEQQQRWTSDLAMLRDALDRLHELQDEWLQTREKLPPAAGPGTAAYQDAQAERNGEGWHELCVWATHGRAVLDIATAARRPRPPRNRYFPPLPFLRTPRNR